MTALTTMRPLRTASPAAVRLRDLPRAEQARFAQALQRSRTTASERAAAATAA